MSFQTRWSVGVRHLVTGEKDAHGNAEETHAAPVDLPVYFVAPASTVEPYSANRDLLTTDLAVLCPKSDSLPGPRDLVLWQGKEHRVEGDVSDFTFGPFRGPGSDVSFVIRRVEG